MSTQNKLIKKLLIFSLLINILGIAYIVISIMVFRSGVAKNFSNLLEAYPPRRKEHFETLPNTKGEVIFLGNSITDACPWNELFQNPLIKNRGIAGDKSAGVLQRLYEVLESEPDQIFIMIGTNDLAAHIKQEDILHNYEEIFKEIASKSPYTQVFVQSILPINPKLGERVRKNEDILLLNQKLEALCARQKVGYIDLHEAMSVRGVLNPEFSNDGLHLNGAGYQAWKKVLEKYVKKPRNVGNKDDLRPYDPSRKDEGVDETEKKQRKQQPDTDSTLRRI